MQPTVMTHQNTPLSARRASWMLALFLLLFQLPFLSPQDNANANTRLMLTAAIVNQGTTQIDPYAEATGDKAFFDGHYYSDKAPGMAILAIPAYALAQSVLHTPETYLPLADTSPARQTVFRLMVLSTSGLFVILGAVAFFRMALAMTGDPRTSLLATLTGFLATPMLGWSAYFFGHAATGGCLIAAFALIYLMRPDQSSPKTMLLAALAGVVLGLSVSIEYTAAPAAAIVGGYGIYRAVAFPPSRAVGILAVALMACVVAVVPLMIYHTVTFGGPFSVGYAKVVGFDGMNEGVLGLTSPDPKVLYYLSFGVHRGLVWLSPVVLLVPVAMVLAMRARVMVPEMLISGLIILYYFLLNASYHYWNGGASLGPRHVTPCLPFMAVALVYLWARATGWLRWVLYGAAGLSFVISVMSVSTNMTPFAGYMYPLHSPVLTDILAGISTWSFYEKIGIAQGLVFAFWVVVVVIAFVWLWRGISAGLSSGPAGQSAAP